MGRASSAFRFAAPVLLGLAVLLRPVLRPVLRLPAAGRGRAALPPRAPPPIPRPHETP